MRISHVQLVNFAFAFFLNSACVSPKGHQQAEPVEQFQEKIGLISPDLLRFDEMGPFPVETTRNFPLSMALNEVTSVDVYRCIGRGKIPIVLMIHGNYSSKSAHSAQAALLSSWGFDVVTLEVPNRDEWLKNGKKVAELSLFLHSWPGFLGANADGERILLVGHSFGGSAVTLAAANGAPISGLILLDPAVVHPKVRDAMTKVNVPTVLLGADKDIFLARGRENFHKRMGGEFFEITVVGATHDDAQSPSMFSRSTFGVDPFTDEHRHQVFSSAIVASAISIATTGTLDTLRMVVGPSLDRGMIEQTHNKQ